MGSDVESRGAPPASKASDGLLSFLRPLAQSSTGSEEKQATASPTVCDLMLRGIDTALDSCYAQLKSSRNGQQ
jgi:hypothetical protein